MFLAHRQCNVHAATPFAHQHFSRPCHAAHAQKLPTVHVPIFEAGLCFGAPLGAIVPAVEAIVYVPHLQLLPFFGSGSIFLGLVEFLERLTHRHSLRQEVRPHMCGQNHFIFTMVFSKPFCSLRFCTAGPTMDICQHASV